MKKIVKLGFFNSLLFLVCSCDPAASLRPNIDKFKKDNPSHVQTFVTKEKTMSFAWTGDVHKRPIIFVHGSPGSWEAWVNFLQNENLQKNFHLIAVNRPGYGGSGLGETEPSLAKQAAAIIETLKFNDSHLPAILIGHSYGGPVIARMAMDFPEQVSGLVFVAGSVDPNLESTKWYQYPASWWPISALIPKPLRVCNEEIFALKSELENMSSLWPNIKAKVIILQGEEDDLVPPANLDYLVAKVRPESLLSAVRIPKQNHFIPWQRPDLILDAIKALGSM